MKDKPVISFKQYLDESINDKGIFKAIFVIGLPGAGKSYTIKQLKGQINPKVVNTDIAAEFLASKWKKEIKSETWHEFRDTTHRVTKNSLTQYLNGMLPLFIDGTSNDVSNILHRIGILESLGYDVGIVFVHTSLETALKRAEERAKKTGRHVDTEFIRAVDSRNKENADYLKSKVQFFKQIENDSDVLDDSEMLAAFNATQQFFNSEIQNPIGKRTLEQMKAKNQKYLTPEIIPFDVLAKKVDGWYK
jgi:dephospho-CoA kinase